MQSSVPALLLRPSEDPAQTAAAARCLRLGWLQAEEQAVARHCSQSWRQKAANLHDCLVGSPAVSRNAMPMQKKKLNLRRSIKSLHHLWDIPAAGAGGPSWGFPNACPRQQWIRSLFAHC